MSLEQAIENNTKALQSIATSLAVLVAKGTLTSIANTEAPAAETKAEKPKAEPKAKAEPKEKPLAEKTNEELMAETLAEDAAETVPEEEDLLGGEPEDDLPKLPAGTRDTAYAKANLLPVLSKLGREQVIELLGEGNKISDIPTDQWDKLFADGCKLLKAAGKL